MRMSRVIYFGAVAAAIGLSMLVGQANAALIHKWELNETTNPSMGTTALDSVGSMNGTYGETNSSGAGLGPVVGEASLGSEYGTSATFDGVDDVVGLGPGLGQLDGTGTGFSVAAWIKPVQLDVVQYIIANDAWDGTGWGIFIRGIKAGGEDENKLDFLSPGEGYGRVSYDPFITEDDLGEWIHLAVTVYDPRDTGNPGGIRFYKNGQNVPIMEYSTGTPTDTADPVPVELSTDPFWIGCGFGDGDGPWKGGIDDVCVYDHVLSDLQVAMLAGVTSFPGDANCDGYVDEVDATYLADNWLSGPDATWYMGDFNDDGYVNDIDATMLAANWSPTSGASVPEPGTIALCLCLMATVCLGGRIKRIY